MALTALMTLTACGTPAKTIETSIIPAVVVPTVEERQVMREKIPRFYIRFSEQQRQLMIARDANR